MKMKALVGFLTLVHVSQQSPTVSVYEGVKSVQLPCQSSRLPEDTTVVWHRYGSNPSIVHQHRHVFQTPFENQHYSGRTSMSDDALETRDLSLTLEEPHLSDSGVYLCKRIRKGVELFPRYEVKLQVIVLQHNSTIGVYEGEESVRLPCQSSWFLSKGTTVVWSRIGFNPSTVHQHLDEKEPRFQNQHYSGRTSTPSYALITGDFSLTLKEPHLSDSGVYTCHVHHKEKELLRLIVRLQVTERPIFPPELCLMLAVCLALAVAALGWHTTITVAQEVVEVGDWAKWVTLPFKTRARLPADATVKWKCFKLFNSWTVHVHQNGQDTFKEQDDSYRDRTKMRENPLQAGDLSLTLINPSHGDSGAYTCTVERDGDVIWKRSVRLKIKARLWVLAN
ncbi:butyrophilin-like protein 2 isoform X2 [Pseudochaenichthys georgianus]|uniref:butyrophilin-like protein 2 isoform X2 n=1 Tax=Pseudochaenichthys georgianus TaxID=52239 RepID=UPI00146ACE54|nr:matrix remodeling-associated protein 8-like isoform X2 [Pseudochaenichthys georgianus]